MAQESESRSLDKVIVRLPDGMRDRIKAAADANNRSMNAEIVAALEEKYPAPTPDDRFAELVEWLSRQDAAAQRRFMIDYLSQANLSEADIEKFRSVYVKRGPL